MIAGRVKPVHSRTTRFIKETDTIASHPINPFTAMSTAKSSSGAHILLYPFPTSGHIIPLLDLTRRLLSRGLTITFLVTASNKPLLDPLISSHGGPRFQSLVFPDFNVQYSVSPANRLIAMLRSLREQHYPLLLQWFRSQASPPVAIVSDFFLGWTYDFASEVGVKRIVFSPSGAFAFSVAASTWQDSPQNDEPGNMDYPVTFRNVPNSPTYPWWQINHIYRLGKEGDPDWETGRDNYLANLKSHGVVFNSFTALERDYLSHMKKPFGENRVWAVGPVLPPDDDLTGPANRGGSSSVPCHEVLTWLDSCEDGSVVYVCFGSRTVLTGEQMDALAGALEKSGVHFVLCVRQPKKEANVGGDHGVLPEGFEDRVARRGLVIKGWAPQVAILRHRAVAAFVTHCGWNSVLEGLSAGVVMLTWPTGADQFTNAQLLVDQLRVGIRVGEGTRRIPESNELARVLSESVKKGLPEKERAEEVKEEAMNAVNGGSSDVELEELVKSLNEMSVGKIGGLSNGV